MTRGATARGATAWRATAASALLAGGAAWAALRGLVAAPPGGAERWSRSNHRGNSLTLLEGPAFTAGTIAGLCVPGSSPPAVRAAATLAATGAAVFGAVDDLAEGHGGAGARKGLKGHLGELARGNLTTGGLKVVGIGTTGLLAAALAIPPEQRGSGLRGAADVVVAGALIAGTANLLNLLDLRPGRALKATCLAGVLAGGPAWAAGGAALGLLGDDLAERSMLGDTGANAAGAVIGTALVSRLGSGGRAGALGGVVALTLASEKVSFTRVIESTPGLRQVDAWGRRPRA